ncbi:MAG: hypothetical protein M1431_04215 [Candidatus Thermoplasmatota archaeon]|nr:hypothetical protein [Candidatus Thermoplasmatota archaeon]
MEFTSRKENLLETIEKLHRERIGIMEIRKNSPDLYDYYQEWLTRMERKFMMKYLRKYGKRNSMRKLLHS